MPRPSLAPVERAPGEAAVDAAAPVLAWISDRRRAMVALLRSLCRGDETEADELWQRAAARAWTYRGALREGGRASGWLRQIVFRVWLDERERRRRAPEVYGDLEVPSESSAERGVIAREELELALAALKPIEREILLRMHRDGELIADIAASLSIPINTVKSHARRGRERMLASRRAAGSDEDVR